MLMRRTVTVIHLLREQSEKVANQPFGCHWSQWAVDINAKGSDGQTPLSRAASQGDEAAMRQLLEQKDIAKDSVAIERRRLQLSVIKPDTPLASIDKGPRSSRVVAFRAKPC